MQVLFPDVFDNINELLKPPTDIWNNSEHKPIWPESLKLPQQTFVAFALENYQQKLLKDFIEENYFLYNKSNLIKKLFITELNKLIPIYGSISYFEKKTINELAQIASASKPLVFNIEKDAIKNSFDSQAPWFFYNKKW